MRDDPFSQLGALDQRLFQKPQHSDSKTKPSNEQSRADEQSPDEAKGREGARERTSPPSKDRTIEPSNGGARAQRNGASLARENRGGLAFDLRTKPYRRLSFDFTDAEFEVLEDLKISVRRSYRVSVTKNDIVRCAVGFLIDDLDRNRERSRLVKQLRASK